MKDQIATDKYGEKGKDGVLEIITNKGKGIKVQSTKSLSGVKVVEYGTQIQKDTLQYNVDSSEIKLEKIPFPKGVIYYLDTKEVSKKEFEEINPNDIYSISVLKDKHAIDKYGEKVKDGIVEVITRENKQIKTKSKNSLSNIKVIEYGKKRDTVQHTVEL